MNDNSCVCLKCVVGAQAPASAAQGKLLRATSLTFPLYKMGVVRKQQRPTSIPPAVCVLHLSLLHKSWPGLPPQPSYSTAFWHSTVLETILKGPSGQVTFGRCL